MRKTVVSKSILLIAVLTMAIIGCINAPPPTPIISLEPQTQAAEGEPLQIIQQLDEDAVIAAAVETVEARAAATQAQLQSATVNVAQQQESLAIAQAETVTIEQPRAAYGASLQDTLPQLYRDVNPSVVFIRVATTSGGGSGSGFVYDNDGHIVTNNHVVDGARDLEVEFADGSLRKATITGQDADSDLAVIKVSDLPASAPPLPRSNIDTVEVGEFVVAIGNPFGEQGSMSLGIVSGLGRSLGSQRIDEQSGFGLGYQLPQVIQTDAPINPGNSGGPLLDLNGDVVGVNSAIRTTTGTNSGVGFSIPVNAVNIIAPSLIANGEYKYPFMGLGFASLGADDFERFGLPSTGGAYVSTISPGGPADRAGVQPADGRSAVGAVGNGGDLIVQIDDRLIRDFDDLNSYLVFNTVVGQTINMRVIRDGEEIAVPLTLGERP